MLVPLKDEKKYSNIQAFSALLIMALDLCLARFFGVSIATDFDLNFVKCKSRLHYFSVGYFQHPEFVDPQNITNATEVPLEEWGVYADVDAVVLHIRGGDALLEKNQDIFSAPDLSWIRQKLKENLANEKLVTVVSNDHEYAERLLESFNEEHKISFKCNLTIEDTMSCALRSKHFIGSHSTLSFWICVLRQNVGKSSSIPDALMNDFLRVTKSGRYVESSI